MKRLAVVAFLALAGHANAQKPIPASWAGTCPAGVPTQMFHVYDQARTHTGDLARVERAVTTQSLQLRAAWGTPCATWGHGGWKVYLKGNGEYPQGDHYCDGNPYLMMYGASGRQVRWSAMFSHEIIETLVDPCATGYMRDNVGWALEVADPVNTITYDIRGVAVQDFVLPAWYAGATYDTGGAVAPAPNSGPWDHARALTAPWQTRATDITPACGGQIVRGCAS